MNHYHSDHITEDKEARIQERLRRCYARAYWRQKERYVRLCQMTNPEENEIHFWVRFNHLAPLPKTEEAWTAQGFKNCYANALRVCESELARPQQ